MAPRQVRAIAAVILLTLSAAASAQWERQWGWGGRARARMAAADSFDGAFNFCRGAYTSGRRDGSGNGWTTDYPDADINFSIRLSELTKVTVSRTPQGEPNHLVVRLADPYLFRCPFVMMTDVGELLLSDEEARLLREYLEKGGFLWVDDFWGPWAWDAWVREIAKALPAAQFPIVDITPAHPIFRTLFEVGRLPQIPSINSWRGLGGATSELGDDSAEPTIRAISDRAGRIIVVMTHNTDISDAWEREAADPRYFLEFSPNGYAVGLNIALYAMSH